MSKIVKTKFFYTRFTEGGQEAFLNVSRWRTVLFTKNVFTLGMLPHAD